MIPPQIDTHAQVTYDERLRSLAQLAQSQLRGTVLEEIIDGSMRFFDGYGSAEMIERSARGQSNTPQELFRNRRVITPRDFEYTEEFDLAKDLPRIRRDMLEDSDFTANVIKTIERKYDQMIIEACHADALEGKLGENVVPYDISRQAFQGAAIPQLFPRAARKALKQDDAVQGKRLIAQVSVQDGLSQLLDSLGSVIGSVDSNTHRALIEGQFKKWLGFEWHLTTQIEIGGFGATGRWNVFRTFDTVLFGILDGSIEAGWEKLPGRGDTWQYTLYGTMAATRQFENQIYRIDVPDFSQL